MAAPESEQILNAIKESGHRTEVALGDLAGEIRTMAQAITKGFAGVRAEPGGNGTYYGMVATFATVILSLGVIMLSAQGSLRETMMLLNDHQKEASAELDEKLQNEITASKLEIEAKFGEVDAQSEHRHDAQQREIDEIKSWFKAPELKDNGQ